MYTRVWLSEDNERKGPMRSSKRWRNIWGNSEGTSLQWYFSRFLAKETMSVLLRSCDLIPLPVEVFQIPNSTWGAVSHGVSFRDQER